MLPHFIAVSTVMTVGWNVEAARVKLRLARIGLGLGFGLVSTVERVGTRDELYHHLKEDLSHASKLAKEFCLSGLASHRW